MSPSVTQPYGSQGFSAFDWNSFANAYRAWGREGGAFPSEDHLGQLGVEQARIWDWSLSQDADGDNGSPALLSVLPVPSNLNIRSIVWEGVPVPQSDNGCQAIRPGSRWAGTINRCFSEALLWAVEIQGDGLGNENNLCEAGETCLLSPNIGSYQGHGDIIDLTVIPAGGNLPGGAITLKKYEHNGY